MKIGIIGIGLIGSSLVQALLRARKDLNILTCDTNIENLETARDMGLGHAFTPHSTDIARECDIIFICVPVRSMGQVVAEMADALTKGTIITDVGSVKSTVIRDVEPHIPQGCFFVPGHPVAGLESAGPAKGFAELFENRSYVFTPSRTTTPQSLKRVRELIETTGAKTLELDPETHDRVLGFTSHLPHVIAFAAMLESHKMSEDLGLDISIFNGGSYEDMTRVSTADLAMWRDIFLTNSDNIRFVVKNMMAQVDKLLAFMEDQDIEGLSDKIDRARQYKLEQLRAKKERNKTR